MLALTPGGSEARREPLPALTLFSCECMCMSACLRGFSLCVYRHVLLKLCVCMAWLGGAGGCDTEGQEISVLWTALIICHTISSSQPNKEHWEHFLFKHPSVRYYYTARPEELWSLSCKSRGKETPPLMCFDIFLMPKVVAPILLCNYIEG